MPNRRNSRQRYRLNHPTAKQKKTNVVQTQFLREISCKINNEETYWNLQVLASIPEHKLLPPLKSFRGKKTRGTTRLKIKVSASHPQELVKTKSSCVI